MARWKLGDALKDSAWRQAAPEGEDLVQADEIDFALCAGIGKDGLDFRGKKKGSSGHAVKERPHPHPIPGNEQLAFGGVPDRKGPLAVKFANAILPLVLVQ